MARRDVRAAIIEAAEVLAVEKGFIGVTTKEVARAAACSEGSIYNHFADRSDLLAQVVANRMLAITAELADGSVEIGADGSMYPLVAAVGHAYAELVALSTSLFADPAVLQRFNAVLQERGATPSELREAVARRLHAGQQAGILRADVDADAIALLLTGACHEIGLHRYLSGAAPASTDAATTTVADTLQTLLRP